MSDPVFDAFAGEHFDPVFALTAVASHAEAALRFDVPELHPEAKQAVAHVAEAALGEHPDTAVRIALIEGGAGFGKTHRLVTALLELSRAGRVYPAVMQLSAKVDSDRVSLWMLQKTLDELRASHFGDARGRPPLKRLADALWRHAPPNLQEDFDEALEGEELERAAEMAGAAAAGIRKALAPRGLSRSDEPLLTALLLLAEDASHEVNAWLRGGAAHRIAGRFDLPSLDTEEARQRTLTDLVKIAAATGAPLVIAIDQIEAITRIGDDTLLASVVTTALQMVENTPQGLGIVISALKDTYRDVVSNRIDDAFRQRIEFGEPIVSLQAPAYHMIRSVIDRRVERLLERTGVDGAPHAARFMAPEWLLSQSEATTIRGVIDAVREYRRACRPEGRFLTREEYRRPQSPPGGEVEDFDKLWEDALDQDLGAVANHSAYDREQMFVWLAEHAAGELAEVPRIHAEALTLRDDAATRSVDLCFEADDGGVGERWQVAFADAPNRQKQLLNQVRSALDEITDAKPALLRNGRFPGVSESGGPDRSPADLERLQAGPALLDLFAAGGRVAVTTQKDWRRLALARRFFEERKDAHGFLDWCFQKSFLLEHAGIGPMTRLLRPEAKDTGSLPDPDPGPHPDPWGDASGSGGADSTGGAPNRVAPTPSPEHDESRGDDPRNHATLLIGEGSEGEAVHWNLDKDAEPALPNFGFLVSGDAGQGKTQAIQAIIAEVARLRCPVLAFDFKNDYSGPFAEANGFEVIDLNDGLPFNPLKLPPQGPSGAQAIDHVFEIAGILGETLHLGDQQKALLRDALAEAYTRRDVPLREWVDPDEAPAPAFSEVIAMARERDEKKSEALVNRLGLLHGKRLLPSDAESRLSFSELLHQRIVLSFMHLPNDDQLKRAIAELILIQLQGRMLRGEQPRALRRLLVFDEAWRAAESRRLIQLAREGRAFGVGLVAGSQFADDLSSELTGNLASKLHLFNSDAGRRRRIVQSIFGTTAGNDAKDAMERLGALKKFEGVIANQQHSPCEYVTVLPYFRRT